MNRTTDDILDACVPALPRHVVQQGSVVTIGNYDGVHMGHRAILSDARARADILDLPLVALTFSPHPASVFGGMSPGELRLSTDAEREALLREAGVDTTLTIAFTREFASLEAEDFIRALLVARLGAREVHVGYDFNFGRGRRGDAALLRREGALTGLDVVEHGAVMFEAEPVSSTRVRRALAVGNMRRATTLLTRPWSVSGISEHGAGRGRDMGIPTVNLYPADRLLPPFGVYATRLYLDDASWPAITNVGTRPTFDDGDRVSIETLALAPFPDDVHGRELSVSFLARIREERTFASADALREQIGVDVAAARAIHAEGDTA